MDTLKNKAFAGYDYTCRYTTVPYYYDTLTGKEVYGIGSRLKKTTSFISHKVKSTDTLDILALKYYNNPTYWWIIADFNDIWDAFMDISAKFETIKIPNISSIEFGDER